MNQTYLKSNNHLGLALYIARSILEARARPSRHGRRFQFRVLREHMNKIPYMVAA